MPAKQLRLRLGRLSSQQFDPVANVREGARKYAETTTGQSYKRPSPQLQQDPAVGFHIQREYRQAQNQGAGPRTRESYDALRNETNHQYEYMTRSRDQGGLGLRHQVTEHDPYEHAHEMAHDVRHGTIKTWATASTGSHGHFTDEDNDRFRAVHDVFGHAATGRGFSRHGEEAAWRSHVQMFSPKAREAMTSETRGQNSIVNYAPKATFVDQAQAVVPMSRLAQNPNASSILKQATPKRAKSSTAEQGRLFR